MVGVRSEDKEESIITMAVFTVPITAHEGTIILQRLQRRVPVVLEVVDANSRCGEGRGQLKSRKRERSHNLPTDLLLDEKKHPVL